MAFKTMKRIGLLTGGGDCPGLNAAIRAVVRKAFNQGYEVLGIRSGWKGLMEKDVEFLNLESVSGILYKGGTILGTSRINPLNYEGGAQKIADNIKELGLSALIVVGGGDTLSVAKILFDKGIPLVGIPKTIENDLIKTDYSFGFDTAVSVVTEAIDRLHTTAESHNRVMVVEVMGRHAGWIATVAGLAGGADCVLIPETPFDIDEVCRLIQNRHKRGKNFSIIVVAEGARPRDDQQALMKLDQFGYVRLGSIVNILSEEIEKRTGFETRVTTLGYIQRGGSPTAFDRVLATRFAVKAVELIEAEVYGKMVSLQGNQIVAIDLSEGLSMSKPVDMELYKIAGVFFG
jgi:phosphofructokinase-like protein